MDSEWVGHGECMFGTWGVHGWDMESERWGMQKDNVISQIGILKKSILNN